MGCAAFGYLNIFSGALGMEGLASGILASAVRRCTNLTDIWLLSCDIDDVLSEFVSGIRGLHHLRTLDLPENNFGRDGCEVLMALLKDPNGSLTWLDLEDNERLFKCSRTIIERQPQIGES